MTGVKSSLQFELIMRVTQVHVSLMQLVRFIIVVVPVSVSNMYV